MLGERWLKEEEERKRKQEEEEENKFDFSSFLLDSKKSGLNRKGVKPGVKRGVTGAASNVTKNGGIAGRTKQTAAATNIETSTTKRKAGMTKR